MKSPKNKKMRTKEDGGMSLWSRLRFAIDFDDDETTSPAVVVSTGVVIPNFITNLEKAIKNTIVNYAGGSSTSNFITWFKTVPSKTKFINEIDSAFPNPLEALVEDIITELVIIDNSLSSFESKISNILNSSIIGRSLAIFTGGSGTTPATKQPITAMEPVLIAQLCNDKLKNAINGAGLGITVADGRGIRRNKLTTRKSRGRKSRSPSRR